MEKRLAMTSDGKLTYCTSSEENIGKGKCNHIAHQKQNEDPQEFLDRANDVLEKLKREKAISQYNYGLSDQFTIKFLKSEGMEVSLLPSGAYKINIRGNDDIKSLTLYTRDENYLVRFQENMGKAMMEYFDYDGEYEQELEDLREFSYADPKVYIYYLFRIPAFASGLSDTLYEVAAINGGWSEHWKFKDEEGKTGLYMNSLPEEREQMEKDIDNGNISEYSTIWISNEESPKMINYLDENF